MRLMLTLTLLDLIFLAHSHPDLQGNGISSIDTYNAARNGHATLMHQRSATVQNSFMQKTAIAQSSIDAATTAQAAFFGKQILLRSLEKLSKQAHHALTAEMTQLEISRKAASMATITAQQATEHVQMLNESLKTAQMYAMRSRKSADYANSEYVDQMKLLGKAKEHLESIERRLMEARNGYAETQMIAEKAAGAAQEAQSNAVSAAVLAAMEFQQEAARLNFRKDKAVVFENTRSHQFKTVGRSM